MPSESRAVVDFKSQYSHVYGYVNSTDQLQVFHSVSQRLKLGWYLNRFGSYHLQYVNLSDYQGRMQTIAKVVINTMKIQITFLAEKTQAFKQLGIPA